MRIRALLQLGCLTLWAWVGILSLAGIGLVWLITARVPQIVHVSGIVVSASDHYERGEYDSTRFSLRGDSRSYRLLNDILHPALPSGQPYVEDRVDLWINPDIDWFNIDSTEVFAISLAGDRSPDRPARTTWKFDDPSSVPRAEQIAGLTMLGIVALVIGLGAVWEYFEERDRPTLPPLLRGRVGVGGK
jgi:hypothetical protein